MILRKPKFAICAALAASCLVLAEDKPDRVEPDIAARNLKARVDPTTPPLAKAIGVGGSVVVDIVTNETGRVASVTLVSGHPMLAPALIEAVKKWEYIAFLKDGKPWSVITRVD